MLRSPFGPAFTLGAFALLVSLCSTLACGASGANDAPAPASEATTFTSRTTGATCTADSQCAVAERCVMSNTTEFRVGRCEPSAVTIEPVGGAGTSAPSASDGGSPGVGVAVADAQADVRVLDASVADANVTDANVTDANVTDAGTVVPSNPCGAAIFGPAAANARGGQRVFDSKGRLYFTTYWDGAGSGTLARVPAGGGTIEVLKSAGDWSSYAWVGAPYVEDDDRVLVSTKDGVVRYHPSTGASEMVAPSKTNGFGFSPVVDAQGRLLHAAATPNLFAANGTSSSVATFYGAYAAVHDGALFLLSNHRVAKQCLDGVTTTPIKTWSVTDAYGITFDAKGDLYFTQGNTTSPKVFRLTPSTSTLTAVATIPGYNGAAFIAADDAGYVYVSPWPGRTVWRVSTATGARVVYGCEQGGKACGATN